MATLHQNYPYTDLQTVNLDSMLLQVKENKEDVAAVTETATATAEALATETADRIRNVNTLQTEINNIIAGTAQVQDRAFNVNRKRRLLFVADEFATIGETGYCEYAANCLGVPQAYRQVISSAGAGFHPASYALARTFTNMLASATLTIPVEEITDVIFTGGAYDVGAATSDIAAGINDACAWVKENLVNARVWILFSTWRPDRVSNNDYINTYNTYRLYAAGNGAAFDYSGIALHYSAFLDNTRFRPNEDGARSLGQVVAQILSGTPSGAFDILSRTVNVTASGPVTAVSSNMIKAHIIENNVYVNYSGRITFDGTTLITLTTWYDIGTVSNYLFSSTSANPQSATVPCVVNYANGVHVVGSCELRIVGNTLQANLRAVNLTTGGWYAPTAISTVLLLGSEQVLSAVAN